MIGGRLDYTKLTDEIFKIILAEIIVEKGSDLIQNPKIYSILCEELKDDVLERWKKKHAHIIQNAELLDEWEKIEEQKLLKEEDYKKR
jgi:hypothetical protein